MLSKWFMILLQNYYYKNSPQMFVDGGTKTLDTKVRWTCLFTWFGPPERNTLRSRRECCIAVCVTMFKAELRLSNIDTCPVLL
jgi:hypothetical protein